MNQTTASKPSENLGAPALRCGDFVRLPVFTREQWLSVRVVDALLKSGLDINTSPARAVWAAAQAEIEVWMERHGMALGLRSTERDKPNIAGLPTRDERTANPSK